MDLIKQTNERLEIASLELKSKNGGLSEPERQQLIKLKCRQNFLAFAIYITQGEFKPFHVHRELSKIVQKIGDGDIERSIISLPPRTGKSTLISRIFPIWQLGRSPKAQFILASYAFHLVNEHARFMLKAINSTLFKKVFPEVEINPKNQGLGALRTEDGGLIKMSSAGSDVTGFGYGVISDAELPGFGILDDIIPDGNSPTVMESAYNWTIQQFLTRGLPNHGIICMGTRFHLDDVIGRLLKNNKGWFNYNVPAICVDSTNDPLGRQEGESFWPEYFPVKNLLHRKNDLTDEPFEALYQGNPQGSGGAIFKKNFISEFNLYDRKNYYIIYMTVDTAYKKDEVADYSALAVFGVRRMDQSQVDVLHMDRGRWTFDELIAITQTAAKQWHCNVVFIEGRSLGEPLIQSFKKQTNLGIKELRPVRDKRVRANSVVPLVSNHQIKFYKFIPRLEIYLDEICSFPFVTNDDITDVFVYGLMVYQNELAIEGGVFKGDPKDIIPQIVYSRIKTAKTRYNKFANYF